MKPDLYTKAVLTVIMLALVMIACNQYVRPSATVEAQGPFASVQFAWAQGPLFFDTRSGETWYYGNNGPELLGRLTKLGQPLAKK